MAILQFLIMTIPTGVKRLKNFLTTNYLPRNQDEENPLFTQWPHLRHGQHSVKSILRDWEQSAVRLFQILDSQAGSQSITVEGVRCE